MMIAAWIFDGVLAAVLPLLAWRLLSGKDLFQAVVFFIVFGLLLSLAWVRLHAPDVALAEAAIGAGLTGALFLDALDRMRMTEAGSETSQESGAAHDNTSL